MNEAVLSLSEFGVAFGEKIILSNVTLDIPSKGVMVLMGPAGTGKSTLLRTLAGVNSAVPTMQTWGNAMFAGKPLSDTNSPALVVQNVKLMMASILENVIAELPERQDLTKKQQRDLASRLLKNAGLEDLANSLDEPVVNLPVNVQRHLAILRSAAANPKLLCIDEPTTGIGDSESERLIKYIKQEAKKRAVIIVVHNQKHARQLQGITGLLAGGVMQEIGDSDNFFADPKSEAAKTFVRSGSCCVPSPNAKPEEIEQEVSSIHIAAKKHVAEYKKKYVSDALGPRGFLWLKNGVLAGTPRPGIVADMDYDLAALKRVGITVLVSLTTTTLDSFKLAEYGIKSVWFPIKDMGAPSPEEAITLCKKISELVEEGEIIAVHCRAGLGRTGTVLAAQLIWEGRRALDALETVRRIEPRWVQSEEQVAFLEAYEKAINV